MSRVKLVVGGVVQVDEVDATALPVVIGPDLRIAGIVFQALRLQRRGVEPRGEPLHKLCPSFWESGFVVADSEVEGQRTKRLDLVLHEVVPGAVLVVRDPKRSPAAIGELLKVLIDGADPAQISQMPIERGMVAENAGSNAGHDYIAAIAGIAGHGEVPSGAR